MQITTSEAEQYCAALTEDEPDLLKEINRDTHANVLQPRMLSGHFQGRLLSLISHLIKPKRILEIGTYTGYSALCMAEGMAADGKLITIEYDEEKACIARENIAKSSYVNQIEVINQPALDVIPQLNETFDLVFIDADKMNYQAYYDAVFPKVNSGGIILSDNVLWDSKVFDPSKNDNTTTYLRDFNQTLKNDKRTQKILLPIRDGLFVSRKI